MRERRERGTGEGKFDSDVLPGEAWETEGTGRAEVGLICSGLWRRRGLRSVAPVIGILLDAEEVRTILRKEAQNGT